MTKNKKTLFILDPGHGIQTPGKRSPEIPPGFYEWRFVREISEMIKERSSDRNWEVESTIDFQSDPDESITLEVRCFIANFLTYEFLSHEKEDEQRSVYFVSIHTNAAGNNGWYKANGCKGFIAKRSSYKSKILSDLLVKNLGICADIKSRGTERKNFNVVKNTKCPAVLIETLFHTSKKDCEIADKKKDEIVEAFIKTFDDISER